MRKNFLIYSSLFFLSFLLYGCTTPKTFKNTHNLLFKESSGFLYLAILVEANSNFSSLIYDKTSPDFDVTMLPPTKKISLDKKFYVVPPLHEGEYDESIKNLIEKILFYNKLGVAVKNVSEADYIMVVKTDEPITKLLGTNRTKISFEIVNKDYTTVAFASVEVTSSSDKNFFYFPAKNPKPVSYLKAKGLEHLIEKTFPSIFDIKEGGNNA